MSVGVFTFPKNVPRCSRTGKQGRWAALVDGVGGQRQWDVPEAVPVESVCGRLPRVAPAGEASQQKARLQTGSAVGSD